MAQYLGVLTARNYQWPQFQQSDFIHKCMFAHGAHIDNYVCAYTHAEKTILSKESTCLIKKTRKEGN